jgi:hypothetical protein
MQAVLHWNIDMAIEITSKGGVFFATVDFLSCITMLKDHVLAPSIITADYIIIS